MSPFAHFVFVDPALPDRTSLTEDERRAMDEEDRKYDDTSEGIDWDEIIESTQADFEAGNYAFNSAKYPSHEAAMKALDQLLHSLLQEAINEATAISTSDAAST